MQTNLTEPDVELYMNLRGLVRLMKSSAFGLGLNEEDDITREWGITDLIEVITVNGYLPL